MTYVMMKRVRNARRTAMYARNEKFRAYWNRVADELEAKVSYG